MTLRRRYQLATLALAGALALWAALAVALLWWWAYQWGEAPASPQPPLDVAVPPWQSLWLWLYACFAVVGAAAARVSYAARLAALAGATGALPLAKPEYLASEQPARLPLAVRWRVGIGRQGPGALVAALAVVVMVALTAGIVAVAALSLYSVSPLTGIALGFVAIILAACCIFFGWIVARMARSPYAGVIADGEGVRRLTRRGVGPLLAWESLRLFTVADGARGLGALYAVYDTRGQPVDWVVGGPELVDYAHNPTGDAQADARALVALVAARSGLELRACDPALAASDAGNARTALAVSRARVWWMALPLVLSPPLVTLAIGVAAYHGPFSPALNVAAIAALALCALALVAAPVWWARGSLGRWGGALALVGGALTLLAVYTTPPASAPAWAAGGFILQVVATILVVVGALAAFTLGGGRRQGAAA